MTQSPETKELIAALIKAQAEVKQPKKNSVNPHFKSKFADLGECFDCVREPLNKNGLVISQLVVGDALHTILLHTSGQWLTSVYPLVSAQQTPQGIGSAITYARRYALCAMLGLVADADDDANEASTQANANRAAIVQKMAARKPSAE
jgi:hypothetical protein